MGSSKKSSSFLPLFICAFFILTLHVSSSASSSSSFDFGGAVAFVSVDDSECRGSIAECMAMEEDEEEFALDSETNRRILAAKPYIGYDTLRQDTVSCSRSGTSYYNCRPGAQANSYSRGCSRFEHCRQ